MSRSSMLVLATCLALLPACWLSTEEVGERISLSGNGDDPDDTGGDNIIPPLDDLDVREVEPRFGSTLGGDRVAVDVRELAESGEVEVRFQGVRGSDVEVDGNTVWVTVPPGQHGAADVTVDQGDRSTTLSNGYFYYSDETGKTGVIGSFSWFEYPGNDLNFDPIADNGRAWLMPIEPTATTYALQVFQTGTMDTCVTNESDFTVEPVSLDLASVDLTRQGGGDSLNLGYRFQDERFETTLSRSDYIDGATYDLEPVDGTFWPEIGVEGIVELPHAFTVDQPALGWTSFPFTVSPGFDVSWSGGQTADYVGIWIDRYDAPWFGAAELQDRVTCVASDDGFFHVPSGAFTGWDPSGQIWIQVARIQRPSGTLPHNNAASDLVGAYWVGGVGYQN